MLTLIRLLLAPYSRALEALAKAARGDLAYADLAGAYADLSAAWGEGYEAQVIFTCEQFEALNASAGGSPTGWRAP